MKERFLSPELTRNFLELPVGSTLQLPVTLLNPVIIDDFTSSHTPGPIEVYYLHKIVSNERVTALWIADGNHRYFEAIRDARFQAYQSNTTFNEDEVFILTRKIIPDQEHDIRYIFRATEWFD